MDPFDDLRTLTRRHFLQRTGASIIGTVGLAMLLNEQALGDQVRTDPFAPKKPHFPPRAKRVIFLNMTGAPSQPDLLDYKPLLKKLDGQAIPESAVKGLRLGPFTNKDTMKVFQSPWHFEQYGQSGMWVSELLPHLREIVDDVTFVRSMNTNEIN